MALTAAACSSARRAPIDYPSDPDKDATYCLRWEPPTYRSVPQLCECAPAKVCQECSWRKEITFKEVCTPGCYEPKCSPCREHKSVEIVATPGRTEWRKAPCACEKDGCCYKAVDIPPTTKCCEVTETEKGLEYCAFKPPQYDVVQQTRLVAVPTPVYRPAQYKVVWQKEEFMPGRWTWVKRTDCCPPCGCGPSLPPRAGFATAPGAD
jgi:hypothetical protein